MKENSDLIKVYSGTEFIVNLLKDELDSIGIGALVQNEYSSGMLAGFSGGIPSGVDLFIQKSDFKKAEPVIKAFISENS